MSIVDLTAAPHHLPTLAAWHQAEWAYLNPGETLPMRIARMQAYLQAGLIPSTFVYERQGCLAGSAAIVACDMETRPQWTPWLASVFVAPQFRRQGIGGRLVRHVMAQAGAAGYEQLYLFTPDRVAFYETLGWQPVAEEIYRGSRVSVMRAQLHDLETA
ncbi:GNAT family N-acetyltransferase [Methylomonas sp. EFPC3]|uniref:GNAT family N-acetyltransferase n=1 Tax=Methylomonas sp. EFPC3 TaxID=3021710 RepID=UPI0024170008|nr:GNAT family N-acetyltransferase [Methylomonas sp. EFPC3]WFP51191.1 GNAT family N-acetyltransferase [Methylomonas sp. EFPC3]